MRAAGALAGWVVLVSWCQAQSLTNLTREPSVQIGPVTVYSSGEAERVAIGRDVHISAGDSVRSLVVVAGDAVIDGEVRDEVVVVFGSVRVGPAGRIGRELIMVGGPLQESLGAVVEGRPILVEWDRWVGIQWMQEWVRHGLFLARPLPHQHQWAWMLAGVFLVVYLLTAALLPRPLELCQQSLQSQPGAAFVAGLMTLLLLGPVLLLLVASVIGVIAIPFLVVLLAAALVIGKAALYQFAGCQLGGQLRLRALSWPGAGLVLGCLVFFVLYAVPIVGAVVWGLSGTLALGAVVLALARGVSRRPPRSAATPAEAKPLEETPSLPAAAGRVLDLPRAGFWVRFCATALDALLVGVIVAACGAEDFAFLAWVLYHFVCWTWRGTTIGGIIVGIRIVRKDGQPIDYAVALVRCVSALFSALLLFLGFFWAGWDGEKQSWHDKIAGTLVVHVPKASLL